MAKVTAKPAAEKAAPKKPSSKVKVPFVMDIEKASEEALAGLKLLKIEEQLQSDIEWCLGSFRADKNPIGLYDVVSHALVVFKSEQKKKTKAVITKLIADIEKVLQSR
jgi:hypothetical protein